MAIAAFHEHGAAPGSTWRHVDGPQQRILALDIGERVALVESVIAQGHDIGAGVAQPLEMRLGQPAAMAGILAIDDHEVELVALDDTGQPFGDGIAAGTAHHITQEQKLHAAAPKWRTPASVTMASSGTSCGSRGMRSSSCAAKARPTSMGFFLMLANVRS
jgi:hypothetical protein